MDILFPPNTRRYTATPRSMIVEPDGISKIQERKIPHVVRNMLISVAPIIIPLKVFEKGLAIAAGSVRSAMTRMIPTTWINTTTETAIRARIIK